MCQPHSRAHTHTPSTHTHSQCASHDELTNLNGTIVRHNPETKGPSGSVHAACCDREGAEEESRKRRAESSVSSGSDKDRNITGCRAGSERRATAKLDELMPLPSARACVCAPLTLCVCVCEYVLLYVCALLNYQIYNNARAKRAPRGCKVVETEALQFAISSHSH